MKKIVDVEEIAIERDGGKFKGNFLYGAVCIFCSTVSCGNLLDLNV